MVQQAHALHGKLKSDTLTPAIVANSSRQGLERTQKEHVFASITRSSKPAISVTASGVLNGGWATLASFVPDIANLGVSIERMATLVENEVSALARTIREAKDNRASEGAEANVTREAPDTFLAAQQDSFAQGLYAAISSLLKTSVHTPLVSYATQKATDKVIASLMSSTEVEQHAASQEDLEEVLDRQADPSIDHYDDILMKWRGVKAEVDLTALAEEERKATLGAKVQGTGKSLEEIFRDYEGCDLKVYRDGKERIYTQRPQYDEYSAAVRGSKPSGPIEFLADAIKFDVSVSIYDTTTKKTTTYHPDGQVDSRVPTGAIKLESTPGAAGKLGHIVAAGTQSPQLSPGEGGADCFYTALASQLSSSDKSTTALLRNQIADCMENNGACKLLYHTRSKEGLVKVFYGDSGRHSEGASIYSSGKTCGRQGSEIYHQSFAHEHRKIGDRIELGNILRRIHQLDPAAGVSPDMPVYPELRGKSVVDSWIDITSTLTLFGSGVGFAVKGAGLASEGARRGAFYGSRYLARRAIRAGIRDREFHAKPFERLLRYSLGREGRCGVSVSFNRILGVHRRIRIPNAGPNGELVKVRHHGLDLRAPAGKNAAKGPVLRIDTNKKLEFLPEKSGFRPYESLSEAEKNLVHRPWIY